MTRKKFTFVTYCDLPILDADDRLVADLLRKKGHTCEVADWRAQNIDWADAGICVLRSTWDYHLHYSEFLDWLDTVSAVTTVWNSPTLIKWNSDKNYMQELQEKKVPIVPTEFFTRNKPRSVKEVMAKRGWSTAIIKPSIGLCTFGVKKIDSADPNAEDYLQRLLETSDVLLQPYIGAVHERGERALVFLGGTYSHAIRKSAFQPLVQAGEAGESVVEADENELALAQSVMRHVEGSPAFARVDLIRDESGKDLVMELELVEPSLYLRMVKGSAERFAEVLLKLAANE